MKKIKRNSYIVGKVFKNYIWINIFIAMAISLGVIADSIIVGNLLSSEALSSVNISTPLISLISTFGAMIIGGGTILASIELGKGNIDKVKQIFTTSMFISLICGILICIFGTIFIDEIVTVLCNTEALRPMVKSYISITIYSAPIFLICPGLCSFIRIDNSPKLVLVALVSANIINITLDYIFIKFLGFGIASSSLASSIGFGVAIMVLSYHFTKKKRFLYFTRISNIKEWFKQFSVGFPIAVGVLLSSVVMLFINRMVASELGVLGLSIISIISSTLMFANIFIMGVLQTMRPICGVLFGNEDYTGIRFSVLKSIVFIMTYLGIVTIAIELFPFRFASIFGVNNYEEYDVISNSLRFSSMVIPLIGVVAIYLSLFVIMRREKIALIVTVIDSISIIPIIYLLKDIEGDYIWISFPLSKMITLVLIYFLRKHISCSKNNHLNLLDISINNNEQTIEQFKIEMKLFFSLIKHQNISEEYKKQIYFDILDKIRLSKNWNNSDIIVRVNNDYTLTFILKNNAPSDSEFSWVLGQNTHIRNYPLLNQTNIIN